MTKNRKVLLSFDIEEFDLPQEFGASIETDDMFRLSGYGAQTLLDAVNGAGVKVTFFITAAFAERFPDLVLQMAVDGHEIASHGFYHSSFDNADLIHSRQVLEEISLQKVTGFRMARLAPVDKREIMDAGYLYESSVNPVWLPGRYCNLGVPLKPYFEKCGLLQFPVSALPVCRFPLFWLSFKNLPLSLYMKMASVALATNGLFNMYSHPWEYNKDASLGKWQIPGYITRHAGQEQVDRLLALILYLKKKAEFVTFREACTDYGVDPD